MARFPTGTPSMGTERNCRITIIGCLTFFALIILVCCVNPSQTGIHGLSDYAYTELECNTIYKADDLTVVSRLAANIHGVDDPAASATDYYLAFFHDRNDCPVAAVLLVDDNDDIYARLANYMENEDQNIGDCFVNGYVKIGDSLTDLDYELKKYYSEALDTHGLIPGECMASLEYMLVYYCNGYSDPLIQFLENRYEMEAGS